MVSFFLVCCGCCTCWQVALPSKPSSVTCTGGQYRITFVPNYRTELLFLYRYRYRPVLLKIVPVPVPTYLCFCKIGTFDFICGNPSVFLRFCKFSAFVHILPFSLNKLVVFVSSAGEKNFKEGAIEHSSYKTLSEALLL